MCAINLLLILTQIVQALSGLMRINFVTKISALDAQLAKTSIGEKLQIETQSELNSEQSRREATYYAQKAFLLICDFINAPIDSNKDMKYIRDTVPQYIDLLSTTIMSSPNFVKTLTNSYTEKICNKTLARIAELEWYDIKRDFIACWNLIFQESRYSETYNIDFSCGEILSALGLDMPDEENNNGEDLTNE